MGAVDLRYARAFASVVDEQKLDVNAVQAQLQDFIALLDENKELREALGNPSIPESQKLGVLDGIAAKTGMSSPVRNLIAVVAQHERLHELGDILSAYGTLADEETGVAEASIVSARPLDNASRTLIEAQVTKLTGMKVHASYSEDAALLGGAVVRVGSTVYDGSVRAQLNRLKQKLVDAGA